MASLPIDIAAKWGNLFSIKYKGNGLWTASCPVCRDDGHENLSGPVDRFQIYETGTGKHGKARGWCRRCGHFEWVDDNGSAWSSHKKEQAEKLRRQYAKTEQERLRKKIIWLQQQTFWLHWHDQMSAKHKELWYKEGIGEWAIEKHKLGFAPPKLPGEKGAMSIPYFDHTEIQTLQLRLLSPPTPNDKYRFIKDTCAAWFKPWPDDEIEGVVLVLEGAKKALVTFQNINAPFTYKDKPITIIATPAKDVPHRLIPQLQKAELLIWLLDPDAYKGVKGNGKSQPPAITRNIKLAGHNKSLIVRTVAKIDDMFLEYKLKPEAFQNMINQAGPWRL